VTAVIEGCYQQIPLEVRICPCGTNEVEDLAHYLITCPLDKDLRATLFSELGLDPNRSDAYLINFLLRDRLPYISEK
ncbi:hypothetical protein JRQ81_011736, partial [Phrynocephalus forsythii]